ncbi:hypothetical protein F4809DRAFT_361878 [Biscogniauxia mediterranea]|nr:hypothetical protein F4809DRAFT_361878 [Biscogniauxia mediterranea]
MDEAGAAAAAATEAEAKATCTTATNASPPPVTATTIIGDDDADRVVGATAAATGAATVVAASAAGAAAVGVVTSGFSASTTKKRTNSNNMPVTTMTAAVAAAAGEEAPSPSTNEKRSQQLMLARERGGPRFFGPCPVVNSDAIWDEICICHQSAQYHLAEYSRLHRSLHMTPTNLMPTVAAEDDIGQPPPSNILSPLPPSLSPCSLFLVPYSPSPVPWSLHSLVPPYKSPLFSSLPFPYLSMIRFFYFYSLPFHRVLARRPFLDKPL